MDTGIIDTMGCPLGVHINWKVHAPKNGPKALKAVVSPLSCGMRISF